MKYLEDTRLTQLTSELMGAFLNTRGSGSGGSSVGFIENGQSSRGGRSKSRHKHSSAGKNKNDKGSSYYAYNPAGYSTSGSSCRAIYGRVEAYTTKRAGSDKKTAFEVGERYAAEMERLNQAVETLKERKKQEKEKEVSKSGEKEDAGDKIERRPRSRSVDGVTFATSASPRIVYDRTANAAAMMGIEPTLLPLEEGVEAVQEEEKEAIKSHAHKRVHPLEGILKQPSSPSNKRLRATSFDISTGPSNFYDRYHHSESSSLLVGTDWGDAGSSVFKFPLSIVHPTIEEDSKTRPLVPQPSLYQSSIGEQTAKTDGASPAMVPRRLLTDLILTLNASYPDYDFGDAQVSDFCTLSISEAVRRVNERLAEFAATTDAGRDFLPRFWSSIEDVLFGDLKDCEVYSYAPRDGAGTGEDDPLEFLTRSMAGDGTPGVSDEDGSGGGDDGGDVVGGKAEGVFFTLAEDGRIVSDDLDANLPNEVSPSSCGDYTPQITLWSMNYFFISRNKKRIVLFACVQTMRTPQGGVDDDYVDYDYGENNVVFDEARREKEEERGYNDGVYPSLTRMSDGLNGSPSGGSGQKMREMLTSPSGDESVGVMVEDTDIEEGLDFDGDDADGEEAEGHGHNDFDTGTMSVPSQVA
mmetsp:Transcript_23876/g.51048  ORF Transcript_23876/g.51048 Transcript_23876/m.51048 type:complete len:637 (-) Transcript_23876:234-2144(-)